MNFCKRFGWLCLIMVLLVLWYTYDAVYPKWDFTCYGTSYSGIPVPPADPGDVAKRYIKPPSIDGCKFAPENELRKIIDWVFPSAN